MADYSAAVNQLRSLGRPHEDSWQDYPSLGIGAEHVPELLRLLCDTKSFLHWQDLPEDWALIHAYRALGQLRAPEAVRPFLDTLNELETHDADEWMREDARQFFLGYGPSIHREVIDFFQNSDREPYSRWMTADVLAKLAKQHPHLRATVIGVLTEQLQRAYENGVDLNIGIVSALLDLKATESADVIKQAYRFGFMDNMGCGTWEEVARELGVDESAGSTNVVRHNKDDSLQRDMDAKRKARAKAKRKMVKASRKRNRR